MRHIKIRIVSNGKPHCTQIFDAETGEELNLDVMYLSVECDPNNHKTRGVPVAHLTIFNPRLDITTEASLKERNG